MRAILVLGMGYGDEGKGTTVDALVRARGAAAVVRFNGGPQAAHHVVNADGKVHCFAQFGAGALVPGVQSFLAARCLIDPLAIQREARALRALGARDALKRLTISPEAVVVTPWHKHLNRLQEDARGDQRHGSCGLGVGQAALDAENPRLPALRAADLRETGRLQRALRLLRDVKVDQAEQLLASLPDPAPLAHHLEAMRDPSLVDALREEYSHFIQFSGAQLAQGDHLGRLLAAGPVVFEGAQGVLLDREYGFFPHVTPSHTTYAEALRLLEGRDVEIERVGVLRAYGTRHGAGPFPGEDAALTARLPELHNPEGRWQGAMRAGWLDLVGARYALAVAGGADWLSLTCLDRLEGLETVRRCAAWRMPGEGRIEALEIKETSFELQHIPTAMAFAAEPELEEFAGWERARGEGRWGLSAPAAAFVEALEGALGVSVGMLSTGPRAEDKLWVGATGGEHV